MNFYEYKITSPYGTRIDPIDKTIKSHNGIDYALPLDTEVLSNVSGTVTTSSYDADGYGNYVVVKDGSGKLHYYAHLNKRSVNVGDTVSVGESIGLSGSTGRSTGAHLHYEVRENNTSVNPSLFAVNTSNETNTTDTNKTDTMHWYDYLNPEKVKDKLKTVVFNIFKFIIIALLIILFVVFITKALDISII